MRSSWLCSVCRSEGLYGSCGCLRGCLNSMSRERLMITTVGLVLGVACLVVNLA